MLFVLGIASAVVAPSIFRRADAVDSAVGEITKVLERARHAAARNGAVVVVDFDPVGEFSIWSGDNHDPIRDRAELRLGAGIGFGGGPGEDVRSAVRFDGLGSAAGGPLLLFKDGRKSAEIQLDPWTGKIDVWRF